MNTLKEEMTSDKTANNLNRQVVKYLIWMLLLHSLIK